MKCYESIMKLCPSRVVPLLFSDWEININVHGKVLAAGTQFFSPNSLHIVWLSVLSIMLLPVGLVWSY